jgi:hypothetical protein
MSSFAQEKQVNSTPMTADQIFERWFLETRSKLLDIAAHLDRIDRAPGSPSNDPRRTAVEEAIRTLLGAGPDRAEHIQMIFSREYDPDWADGTPLPFATKSK